MNTQTSCLSIVFPFSDFLPPPILGGKLFLLSVQHPDARGRDHSSCGCFFPSRIYSRHLPRVPCIFQRGTYIPSLCVAKNIDTTCWIRGGKRRWINIPRLLHNFCCTPRCIQGMEKIPQKRICMLDGPFEHANKISPPPFPPFPPIFSLKCTRGSAKVFAEKPLVRVFVGQSDQDD